MSSQVFSLRGNTCLEPRKHNKHDLTNEKLIFVFNQEEVICIGVFLFSASMTDNLL